MRRRAPDYLRKCRTQEHEKAMRRFPAVRAALNPLPGQSIRLAEGLAKLAAGNHLMERVRRDRRCSKEDTCQVHVRKASFDVLHVNCPSGSATVRVMLTCCIGLNRKQPCLDIGQQATQSRVPTLERWHLKSDTSRFVRNSITMAHLHCRFAKYFANHGGHSDGEDVEFSFIHPK